ncbi:MAG: hypothetical protein RMI79_06235 [Nitrososphaerota archaeon]|nr:hypothetical protein [Nitrososphaerota archaeon]
MTKTGYKSVLIKEEAYQKLKEIAKKEDISVCKTISKIINEYIESHKEG